MPTACLRARPKNHATTQRSSGSLASSEARGQRGLTPPPLPFSITPVAWEVPTKPPVSFLAVTF